MQINVYIQLWAQTVPSRLFVPVEAEGAQIIGVMVNKERALLIYMPSPSLGHRRITREAKKMGNRKKEKTVRILDNPPLDN